MFINYKHSNIIMPSRSLPGHHSDVSISNCFLNTLLVIMSSVFLQLIHSRFPCHKAQKPVTESNQIVQLANTRNYALLVRMRYVLDCLHSERKQRAIIFSVIVETSKRRWNVKEVVEQLQLTNSSRSKSCLVELQPRKAQKTHARAAAQKIVLFS